MADVAHAKPQPRLPPGQSEPVAGRRLGLGLHPGDRRHPLHAPRHARGCCSSASPACSTPCTPGGPTSSKRPTAGDHTPVVQMHHRYGMMLFIASEVMFFVAWFWAYFDAFFRHDDPEQPARIAAIGGALAAGRRRALRSLPPAAVQHADPALTSGTTVTWAHHALLHNDRQGLKWGLVAHHRARRALHLRAGARVLAGRLRLCRQHLRRDLLHGDRLPRLPRAHRHDLPDRLPGPRQPRPLHAHSVTSASSSPPGTGTSSTWSGCSSSPRSTSGAAGASPIHH